MLCALTSWGFFRYRWVLGKFVITIVQLYLGIFILSGTLHSAVEASAHGGIGPAVPLATGTLLMMSAIAFQAWLSVAKPWRRTPWASPGKLPTASPWLFAAAVAVPTGDLLLSAFVTGRPMPVLSLLTVIGYPIYRSVALRRTAIPKTAGTRV
ncbi:MAG: hypothetical protein ACRDT4_05870 [Micromonosporaceae bacterium]